MVCARRRSIISTILAEHVQVIGAWLLDTLSQLIAGWMGEHLRMRLAGLQLTGLSIRLRGYQFWQLFLSDTAGAFLPVRVLVLSPLEYHPHYEMSRMATVRKLKPLSAPLIEARHHRFILLWLW
jgi:hypothetical protein